MARVEDLRTRTLELESNVLYAVIADVIGGQITPQRVEQLISVAKSEGFLLHGVKSRSSLGTIRERGILPLTPEGGYVSYWTCGERIFISARSGSIGMFFDTPFFNYSHSRSTGEKTGDTMILALANKSSLQKLTRANIGPSSDVVMIDSPVPREYIMLLVVEGPNAKVTQQSMFGLLEDTCNKGYKPGSEIFARIS